MGSAGADFGEGDEQGRAVLAPGKERKSLKLIFFKWEGRKSMGKGVIVPSLGEHVGRKTQFPRGVWLGILQLKDPERRQNYIHLEVKPKITTLKKKKKKR